MQNKKDCQLQVRFNTILLVAFSTIACTIYLGFRAFLGDNTTQEQLASAQMLTISILLGSLVICGAGVINGLYKLLFKRYER